MSEKSGIQMLEEICEQVLLLSKRFEVIEQNTKELLGRTNGHKSAPTITGIESSKKKETPSGLAAKIIGKIKNNEGKLVSGVKVKIFGAEGNLIKETKTNRAGEFMCFLPPGTYKAEYFLENIINAALDFIIKKDEKIVRLAQPTPVG